MVERNKRTTTKAIIQSYRNGAFIMAVFPLTTNSVVAKRNIRTFGPVNHVAKMNGETVYAYMNENERIRISQFVTKNIKEPKKDTRKPQPTNVSDKRIKEIERSLIKAYKEGAQFVVSFPPVTNREDAIRALRFFGKPTQKTDPEGNIQFIIDDVLNQIKVVVPLI